MKLALGFHLAQISRENFRFARQAGCTHVVLHLVERLQNLAAPQADAYCFGVTQAEGRVWPYEQLEGLCRMAAEEGLAIEALENIDPSFWHDILLDGPRKRAQIEALKTLLRDMGRLRIPILGYNFSLAGVWGRFQQPAARGGAMVPGFDAARLPPDAAVPRGELNNIVYDPAAPAGSIPPVSREELWQRLAFFLDELVPVAEEAGVRLAAHPDDPPVETLRQTPRLLYRPDGFRQLLDLKPSPANALEFCLGTIQEMPGVDPYAVAECYGRQGAIAYVHLRNVRGRAPRYTEVFIDEGDLDVFRVLGVLAQTGFQGAVIPDHAPQMTSPAPWHTGMAHALGYLRAAIDACRR
jgi:mannonate dehydratase